MPRAFTRRVSPRIADCALTHLERQPIDAARAAAQHAAYEQALTDAGVTVTRLADLPDQPDGVFVEDTAILLGDAAIITRPGAQSRATEADATAADLAAHFEVHRMTSGRLDGGDVLRVGRALYVGRPAVPTPPAPLSLRDLPRRWDTRSLRSRSMLAFTSRAR